MLARDPAKVYGNMTTTTNQDHDDDDDDNDEEEDLLGINRKMGRKANHRPDGR